MAAQNALFGAAVAMTEQESEGTSSFEDYERDVDNLALEVVGQNWSSEVDSLSLQDWEELEHEAWSCHMAMDFPCQEMRDACWVPLLHCSQCQCSSLVELSQQRSLSLNMDGVWLLRRGMCWENGRRNVSDRLKVWKKIWEWVVWRLLAFLSEFELACLGPSIFVKVWTLCSFFRNEGAPYFRLCASLFCAKFRRSKGERAPPFVRGCEAELFQCVWFCLSACGHHLLQTVHLQRTTFSRAQLLRSLVAVLLS